MREISHVQHVGAWMESRGSGLLPSELAQLLGLALEVIWDRAHVTLGEVTLGAICNRVLFNAGRRFSVLAALALTPDPASFHRLAKEGGPPTDGAQLTLAVRFILTELLTVLGNLTAEILTPALHDALSSVQLAASEPSSKSQPPKSASQSRAKK